MRAPAPGLSITPGKPADAPACAAILRAAVRAAPARQLTVGERSAWSSLPPLYHRWAMGPGGERYLLARRGARTLGYAARRRGELSALFVRPGSWRQGVGRALVRAVARAARREGHRTLRVVAARGAIPFYRAVGFRPIGPERVPLPGGRALAAERMRLGLEEAWSDDQWTPTRGRSSTRSRPSRQEASSPR